MSTGNEDSGNADDSLVQTGGGDASEGVDAQPRSADVEEEVADTSGSREIPIGTPVHPDALRELKKLAEIALDENKPDPQTDHEDQRAERTESHDDH